MFAPEKLLYESRQKILRGKSAMKRKRGH